VIVDFVNGYVLAEASGPHDGEAALAAFFAERDTPPAEAVAAQRRALAAGRPRGHGGFVDGLDVILAGLAARLPTARKDPS
jgi:hypothetical protein